MSSKTLDINMHGFETSLDQVILPDLYLVVHIDGRNFTRLTKGIYEFEAPSDTWFRDATTDMVKHLMRYGFRIVYGYTQSDEISLLFHPDDRTLGRETKKINSVLAGEASTFFSSKLGVLACFDCRAVPLPNLECVKGYFTWRREDIHKNSLDAHCYWLLQQEGESVQEATKGVEGKSVSFKNELLLSRNINYNDFPGWQRRGVRLYYSSYEKTGYDPIKQQRTVSIRDRTETNMDLGTGDGCTNWVASLMQGRGQIRMGPHESEIYFSGIFLYQQARHCGAFDWRTEQEPLS